MACNLLFDWIAPLYDQVASPRPVDVLLDKLKLPSTGRLFEAGGGTGRIAIGLCPYIDFLALGDLSFSMLRQANTKAHLHVLQHKAERLPFAEDTFDRILVVDALHHFSDQETAIGELLRVLKRGGRLVIEEPNIEKFAVKLIAWGEKLALMGSKIHTAEKIQAIFLQWGYPSQVCKENFAVWVTVDKE